MTPESQRDWKGGFRYAEQDQRAEKRGKFKLGLHDIGIKWHCAIFWCMLYIVIWKKIQIFHLNSTLSYAKRLTSGRKLTHTDSPSYCECNMFVLVHIWETFLLLGCCMLLEIFLLKILLWWMQIFLFSLFPSVLSSLCNFSIFECH